MSLFLVTGGAGFIGSNIVEELVRRKQRIRVIDNFCEGKKANLAQALDKIELIEGDVRDLDMLRKCCKGVDFVLHQAALRSVAKSVKDPLAYNEVNVCGTINMLLAAREAKVKKFVFASSSSVYGNTEKFPNIEGHLPQPISPYAASKVAGEFYCRVFSELYGLKTVSLRYFNVFGPRQDPASEYAAVVPRFITRMLKGQPPIVDGDGLQSRDFTYVDNVVEANLLAATAKEVSFEVLNISCGRDYSVLQIVDILNDILGKKIKPKFGPPRPGDVRKSLASVSKAKEVLAYEPHVDFREGLKRSVDWFKKNYKS